MEYDEYGCIKTLAIKQTCDFRGKNRLRKQKLSVGLYNESLKCHVIKDIVLSDKEELNPVDIGGFCSSVKAIVVNHGDHAYAKIRYDQYTM